MIEDWDSVAVALRARLDEQGLGAAELSERAGVSPTTVRELLNNSNARRRQPRTMIALAAALDWPPDHLLNVLRHETDDRIRGMRQQLDELGGRLDAMERSEAAVAGLNELHARIDQRLDALREPERGGRPPTAP